MTKYKTNISDITISKCCDGIERRVLDSPKKIIKWIKYKFEEQEERFKDQPKNNPLPLHRFIDLSNCIISTSLYSGIPSLRICDLANLHSCLINNGYGHKYYHEVLEELHCNNSIIYAPFFHQTKFHKLVSFENTTFEGNASFGNCLFVDGAYFQKSIFKSSLYFSFSEFKNNIYFNNAQFYSGQIQFNNSIFNGSFNATELKLNCDIDEKYSFNFNGSVFKQEVNFLKNNLNIKVNFCKAQICNRLNFEETVFKELVNFENSKIDGHIFFSKKPENNNSSENIFINSVSFNKAQISGRIDFQHCKINLLKGCFATLTNNSYLRIYESTIINEIDFTSINNSGVILLEDNSDNINKIVLTGAINSGEIEIENTQIKNIDNRKTARLLKQSALKNGNNIDSMQYREKEMEMFAKEHNEDAKCEEKLLLWMNKKSNNHGTKWTKGIWFTLIFWGISYILFLALSRIDDIIAFLNGQEVIWIVTLDITNGIKYLWSIDFLNLLSAWIKHVELSPKWYFYILQIIQIFLASFVYILGKILIGYGIYQTISAFRKHNK